MTKARTTHYPVRRAVSLSKALAASIDRASEREGKAAGTILREVIEKGWPLWQDSARKARKANRKGGDE